MAARALLDGSNADLGALVDLTKDDDPCVVHDDQEDRFFLESSELAQCTDSGQLLHTANALLAVVLGPARFERPRMAAVTIVGRFDGFGDDGKTTVICLQDSARGTEAFGTPTITAYDENGVLLPPTTPPLNSTYRRYRDLAAKHPSVAGLVELHAKQDPDWEDGAVQRVDDEPDRVATSGTTAAIVPDCGGGCTTRGGLPDNGAPLAINQTISGDVSFSSPGTNVSTGTQEIGIYLFHPAAVGTGTTKGDPRSVLGPVRCDSATPSEHLGAPGRPGCHVECGADAGPGLGLGAGADPRARRVRAGRAGQPADRRVGSGRPLIREYVSPSQQAKKRYQVCGRFIRSGDGDSCDEYPYSTSPQGVPDYAVTEHVPGDQNTRAGRKLSSFYAASHVLDGDPYFVRP